MVCVSKHAITMNEDDVTAVVVCLARYLSAHPNACDSASGIAGWWLPSGNEVPMEVLMRALERLTLQGVLVAATGADGRVRYRRSGDDQVLERAIATRVQGEGVCRK